MTSTDIEHAGSALEALRAEGGALGNITGSEGGVPRITIDMAAAKWVDSLSGLEVTEFTGIVCGLVPQRTLWPAEMGEEKSSPLCKSRDHIHGRPNPKTFPLKESKLALTVIEEGTVVNCSDCELKEWGAHPTRDGSWCTDEMVLVLLADLEDTGDLLPALLTVKRSGMKPTKKYLAGFKRSGKDPFEFFTDFALQPEKRGTVKFATPVYSRGEAVDMELQEMAASNFLTTRAFLTADRNDDESTPSTPTAAEDELPDF